jgi:HEAT repeat protein
MASSVMEVRRRLNAEEPDYPALARELGPDAGPHLRVLVTDQDDSVAAKAAYLASLLPGQVDTVALAARSASPLVRVAAAGAATNLGEENIEQPLQGLLDDADAGVRKTALRSTARRRVAGLRQKVQHLQEADPEEAVRSLARDALSQWPK